MLRHSTYAGQHIQTASRQQHTETHTSAGSSTYRDQLVHMPPHHAQVCGVLLTQLQVLLTRPQALQGRKLHTLHKTDRQIANKGRGCTTRNDSQHTRHLHARVAG